MPQKSDYNGHMIKTLRESKAKLSRLVELASQGEDVLISVRGKVKARLTRATTPATARNKALWVRQLQALRRTYSVTASNSSIEDILAQIREDRV